MTTRIYTPSTGTYGSTPGIHSNWESPNASIFAVRNAKTTKSNTSLIEFASSGGPANTHQTCWQQWITETIQVDTIISGNVSAVFRGHEGATNHNGYLAFCLRVLQGDTSTERGLLVFQGTNTGGSEWGTASRTRVWGDIAIAQVDASAGDRISVEVGMHFATPGAAPSGMLTFGDPSGTADFACVTNLTTNLVPWIQFNSVTITFGTPSTGESSSFFNFFNL